jgi:hypothetical protein
LGRFGHASGGARCLDVGARLFQECPSLASERRPQRRRGPGAPGTFIVSGANEEPAYNSREA